MTGHTTMTTEQRTRRIAELSRTPDALVGSDEGTHGGPRTHLVYETITGERYAVRSFGGSAIGRVTEEEAEAGTAGRIRHFPRATAAIRAAARELADLRRAAR